jgi:neutral ceramidase
MSERVLVLTMKKHPGGGPSPRPSLLATLMCLAFTGVLPGAEPAPAFKAGFAERDITPAIGSEAPGGYGKVYHKSIHDPCKVRAAVFDDGSRRVALVGIDALHVHRTTVLAVRKAIEQQTGIAADAVLIGASHSHSSGPMAGVMPGQYDDASELVKKLAHEYSICADPKYLEKVEKAIVEAVAAADRGRTDVKAGIGKGIEDKVAFNRRFRMRSGLTVTHPGQVNPDIAEPAGPTDPEVGVIGAWDKDGKLLGCVVNFACHATTSPGGISANYVYWLEKVIQGYCGKDTVVVFLNGASGDITQVDNRSPLANRPPERWAEFVGGRIGAEALKVLLSMDTGSMAPVAYRNKVLKIKRRPPAPERVKRCLEIVQRDKKSVDPTEWAFAKEIVLLDAKIAKEPVADVEVQAVQVGPAVFLTDPAEFFCQFGLDLKAGSRFPFTFPVSLANGCVGYVPTEEAFGPRGGGYETRLTSYSNLEITAGRQMVEAGLELARALKPGEVPTRPRLPPFQGNPWSYGSVPPELK